MFWKNFVNLCSAKGTSPNAVASELSLSSGSVTAWKGGTVPRETTLKKIADYFDVTIGYLMGYEKKNPVPTDEDGIKRLVPGRYKEFLRELSIEELLELNSEVAEAIKEVMNK